MNPQLDIFANGEVMNPILKSETIVMPAEFNFPNFEDPLLNPPTRLYIYLRFIPIIDPAANLNFYVTDITDPENPIVYERNIEPEEPAVEEYKVREDYFLMSNTVWLGASALGKTIKIDYFGIAQAFDDQYIESLNKNAGQIEVDTTNFDGNLSALDDTVQKALETLDELEVAAEAWNVPVDTTFFNKNLSALDNTVQDALETLDELELQVIDDTKVDSDNINSAKFAHDINVDLAFKKWIERVETDFQNYYFDEFYYYEKTGIFLVGGNDPDTDEGIILYSYDGESWTEALRVANCRFSNFIDNGSTIVTSTIVKTGTPYTYIYSSSDGISWTQRTVPDTAVTVDMGKARHLNGNFILLVNQTKVFNSTDGITWSQNTTPYYFIDVIYVGGTFYWATETNGIYSSTNFATFTNRLASQVIRSLTYGNGVFVAVGGTGAELIYSSQDGITWSQRRNSANNSFRGVHYVSELGLFFTYSVTDIYWASENDVTTWTKTTGWAYGIYSGVKRYNGCIMGLFADSSDHKLIVSVDGKKWDYFILSDNGDNPFLSASNKDKVIFGRLGYTYTNYSIPMMDLYRSQTVKGGKDFQGETSFSKIKKATYKGLNVGTLLATHYLNWDDGDVIFCTMRAGAVTLNFLNPRIGSFVIEVTHDASSRVLTINSVYYPGVTGTSNKALTLAAGNTKKTFISVFCNGSNYVITELTCG